jgi:hypothetical protein
MPETKSFNDDPAGGSTHLSSDMPRYRKFKRPYGALGRKALKYRRRRSNKYRTRRNFKKVGKRGRANYRNFAKKVAKVLNPSRLYEYSGGNTIVLQSADVNYFIDPHQIMYDNRTLFKDVCLSNYARLVEIYNRVCYTTLNVQPDGSNSFWALKRQERYKLSNFSNSTMFLRVYYLKCKTFGSANNPLALMNNANLDGTVYTGANGANISSNGTGTVSANKTMSIHDYKYLKAMWKIVRYKDYKLEPNEQTTILLSHKARLINQDDYFGDNNRPGAMRMLFRVQTELTADGTITSVNARKGYAYTAQSLVLHCIQQCQIAPRINQQRVNYIDLAGITTPDAANINLGTDPKIAGIAVDTTGTAKADLN